MGTYPYYLLLAVFALAAATSNGPRVGRAPWFIAFVTLSVFIGLRHHVGMDWNNYLLLTDKIAAGDVWNSLSYAEPSFAVLTWISANLGWGIYGVNMASALIFCAGLFRLCKRTSNPWLGIVAAFPFLISVVAMSATRQAAAIGVMMWLLADWQACSLRKRVALILVASSFHASAASFLCFVVLDLKIALRYRAALFTAMSLLTTQVLILSGGAERYMNLYVVQQTELVQSEGALLHVLSNALPALMIFLRSGARNRIFPDVIIRRLSVLAILLVPFVFFSSAATARLSFYLFPVSMFAFSNLPSLFPSAVLRRIIQLIICLVMSAILWVWLNYANSAIAHLNYRNALFIDAAEQHR